MKRRMVGMITNWISCDVWGRGWQGFRRIASLSLLQVGSFRAEIAFHGTSRDMVYTSLLFVQ